MTLAWAASVGLTALSASAQEAASDAITIEEAYARALPQSRFGAVFMTISNHTDQADRLVRAETDWAERVELHTHTEDENGVLRMREIEGGIAIAAMSSHRLQRGGDHVMLMGVDPALVDAGTVDLTLVFEHAGAVEITADIDNDRMPDHDMTDHNMTDQ